MTTAGTKTRKDEQSAHLANRSKANPNWFVRMADLFRTESTTEQVVKTTAADQQIVKDVYLTKTLQTTYISQRQDAIIEQLKLLLDVLHENLNFGPPDNIYVAMFLVKQQQETMKLAKKMIQQPYLIAKLVDEMISRIDMLITELPDPWTFAITPYVNDLQMLLSLPAHEQNVAISDQD